MPSLTACGNPGCSKSFNTSSSRSQTECSFHSGTPVFHEGYKSWSCCPEIKKTEFSEFMSIPGCQKGPHVPKVPIEQTTTSSNPDIQSTSAQIASIDISSQLDKPRITSFVPAPAKPKQQTETEAEEPKQPEWKILHDDKNYEPKVGESCKRTGCSVLHTKSESTSSEKAKCRFHPGPPIFREGSKGYMCCKPRVLEFSDFLSLAGCTELPSHKFSAVELASERPKFRTDHYQTPSSIVASLYVKGVQSSQSKITFEQRAINIDIMLPDGSSYQDKIHLYSSILPSQSSYEILRTKVEFTLIKDENKSWVSLNPVDESKLPAGYGLTFGAGGSNRGTVGGHQSFIDESLVP